MGLTIKRKSESRMVKSVLHRVADIPGGVTVSAADLGGDVLEDGTPVGLGENGLYRVCKTASIIATATNSATDYEVAKGHHFKEGDYFAVGTANGQKITSIDKSNTSKDVIKVGTTLGVAVSEGAVAYQSAGADKKLAVEPVAFVGESKDVKAGENLFVSAWVIGVLRAQNAPKVTDKIKATLKSVVYV